MPIEPCCDAGTGMECELPACEPVDFFELLADPYVPARRVPGAAQLASSRQPEPVEGLGNNDWSNFVRIDGSEAVMVDVDGPGVVTRLWFTFRLGTDHSVGDMARLHLYVDGEEIDFGTGERGVLLGDLTSGTLASFERPWVGGRDVASGAHVVFVPIHFQEHLKVTLDHEPERVSFYQIDWRRLSPRSRVRSFDGTLAPSEAAALDRALDVWIARAERGAMAQSLEQTLMPGADAQLAIDGPTVLRRFAWEVTAGEAEALEAALELDGQTLVDLPAHRWTFQSSPAEPYASALSEIGLASGSMEYPAPVATGAQVTLRNGGGEPITVRARLEHDPGELLAGLGSLRIECGEHARPTDGALPILHLTGERGHYAGQFLVIRGYSFGWQMMEGDHEIAVDGEWTILGTGIEDYFGGAFYYADGPFALPFSGAPGYDLMGQPHLMAGVIDVAQFRHHVVDSINFEDELEVQYEVVQMTVHESCHYWYRD